MATPAASEVLARFSPATRRWFGAAFAAPTPVQIRGWDAISTGAHALLLAPTGSGKTLAAFLWALDRVVHQPPPADAAPERGVGVLYISPLKALVYDVERNLRAPLAGLCRAAQQAGEAPPTVQVAIRTGDTPQRERQRLLRDPADILVTTPESLFLLLTSRAREVLKTVHTVIIDEIHAVAGSKRGTHLALSLERLSALCDVDPQRIGLSATQRPLSTIARFLGGDRPVRVVDASAPPALDLEVVVPIPDLDRPPPVAPPAHDMLEPLGEAVHPMSSPGMDRAGVWPALQERILALIDAHRTTIVFANSRRVCERLCQRLNELAALRGDPGPLCRAHHGSVSHAQRTEIEEALKSGRIPCIVATSSLELGIDMGTVDLVIQVAAPHSVASGLQRVGRAGHGVGELSVGRILPRFKGELLVAAAVAAGMSEGAIESTAVPQNPLDVLCQQIAAMCVVQDRTVDEVGAIVRRASPYASLADDLLTAVLDMLSGHFRIAPQVGAPAAPVAADEGGFDALRPLLIWDRSTGLLRARKGARLVVLSNAGTIPDRGTYGVFPAPEGARIGELDEEMVHESRKGDTFLLGASTWRIVEIKRDRVLVVPAPGEPGRMPFWRGQGPGRPLPLGRALGALVREIEALPEEAAAAALAARCHLDPLAAGNLWSHVHDQRAATGVAPSDRCVVIERFRDEFGDWRICLLCPLGSRITAPWGMALRAAIQARTGIELQVLWTDDGVVLRYSEVDADQLPSLEELIPDPEEVRELLVDELAGSSLFAARFREAAGRALMLPRRRPGQRTPLWVQRMRAQSLLHTALQFPSFPLVLETYRECLQDVFDLPGFLEVLHDIRARRIRVVEVETPAPSPFARSLVFAFVATWLYEGDAPVAERRAAALSLDRALLRELLGEDELRELLDPGDLAAVEAALQCCTPERRVRSLDGLHDLLRRLGDLDVDELQARAVEGAPVGDWLATLAAEGRAAAVRVGGDERWIDLADVALYRDALGVIPPRGVPAAFLQPVARPLEALFRRHARTHGPFTAAALAARYALLPAQVAPVLRGMAEPGPLVSGVFGPAGVAWCDRDVLRRIKRQALARLRGEVEPVDGPAYAAFLAEWTGCSPDGERPRGGALLDVLGQLEGCPVPWSELESRVLPARLGTVRPQELDALCAQGTLAWLGAGALGPRDGRVRLVARDELAVHIAPAELPEDDIHKAILDVLDARGACFLAELQAAVGGGVAAADVGDALWDLAWRGHVSNDTLQPLRALARPRRGSGRRAPLRRRTGLRGLRARGASGSGGRWWRVAGPALVPLDPTTRAHTITSLLLDRYGVLTREAVLAEGVPGGFAAIYPVLRAMEDAGQLRRGWFVAGAGGAQFALAGAVDRLRAARDSEAVHVLAATDPGCAWGGALAWPETEGSVLRREAGATVVMVGGRLVLYLGRGGRSLAAFPDEADPTVLARAVRALERARVRERGASLRVQRVVGPASADALTEALVGAGFEPDGSGLTLPVPI